MGGGGDRGEAEGQGRRITPPVRRAELVRAYRTIGVDAGAVRVAVGFNYPTFEDWVERDRSPAGRTAVVQFAEVRLPGPTNVRSLSVRCPDGTVLRGTHAATIAGAPHVASIHEGRKSIGP